MVDKVALGPVFFSYSSFSCKFSFSTHLSSGAAAIGQTVSNVPTETSFIPTTRIKTIFI
jgi:hypothetical protein